MSSTVQLHHLCTALRQISAGRRQHIHHAIASVHLASSLKDLCTTTTASRHFVLDKTDGVNSISKHYFLLTLKCPNSNPRLDQKEITIRKIKHNFRPKRAWLHSLLLAASYCLPDLFPRVLCFAWLCSLDAMNRTNGAHTFRVN